MRNYLIVIFLVTGIQMNAQLPTFNNPYVPIIREQVKSIDSLLDGNFHEINFELDSVEITAKIWENKIETFNYFNNSGTKLKIAFYLQNSEMLYIRVNEESKKLPDLAAKITEFYFHDNTLSLIWDYYKRPTGIALRPDEENNFYGYNVDFNEDFLKGYVNTLYEKTKTTHNTQ